MIFNKKKVHPTHPHRNGETEFVLKYFPDYTWGLPKDKKLGCYVLDVGATEGFLMQELSNRGYIPVGFDIRPYHTKLPPISYFYTGDIMMPNLKKHFEHMTIHHAIALSTIEHVGMEAYGGLLIPDGDRIAVQNIHSIIEDDGLFIITVPTKFWHTKTGRGYTVRQFYSLISGLFNVFEITQIDGQICASLTKCL